MLTSVVEYFFNYVSCFIYFVSTMLLGGAKVEGRNGDERDDDDWLPAARKLGQLLPGRRLEREPHEHRHGFHYGRD